MIQNSANEKENKTGASLSFHALSHLIAEAQGAWFYFLGAA